MFLVHEPPLNLLPLNRRCSLLCLRWAAATSYSFRPTALQPGCRNEMSCRGSVNLQDKDMFLDGQLTSPSKPPQRQVPTASFWNSGTDCQKHSETKKWSEIDPLLPMYPTQLFQKQKHLKLLETQKERVYFEHLGKLWTRFIKCLWCLKEM